MTRTVRWTATALLLILLSAVAAQALPLPGRTRAPAGLLDTARTWLTTLFISEEKQGSTTDPNGNPPHGDGGGMMDPDGDNPPPDPDPNPDTDAGGETDANG